MDAVTASAAFAACPQPVAASAGGLEFIPRRSPRTSLVLAEIARQRRWERRRRRERRKQRATRLFALLTRPVLTDVPSVLFTVNGPLVYASARAC